MSSSLTIFLVICCLIVRHADSSLGMLPSASLVLKTRPQASVMRFMNCPWLGTDIAGKGLANPLAQVLNLAMMLRYS